MTIENNGSVDAIGINWSITINDGFIFLGRQSQGRLLGIPAGEKLTVSSDFIVGLGRTWTAASVQMGDGDDIQEFDAVVFFCFSLKYKS